MKKQPSGEDGRIILAAANIVSDEIKNKCREKYNISVWDVKNLIWLFDEFPAIKNEFIALLNFPTEDISPERPEPYIFDEPEDTQGKIDLNERLRRIRPGREEYQQYENICIDKWREQKLLGRFWMRVKADIRYKNKVTKSFRNAEKSVLRCGRSYRLSYRIRTAGLHKRNPSGEGEK